MRIIIYEDNEDDVKILKYYLQEFFRERKIKYEVKVYTHSYRMYDEVDRADVVFLDIEGLNENGVKVAEMMRRLNKELLICFVTRFSKYALDGYRASANRYFLKPLKRDVFMKEFASLMKDYLEIYEGFVDTDMYPKKIYYKDIMYVQYYNRKIWLHMSDGRVLSRFDSLKHWKELLQDHLFVQTYKSYLVNMKYVSDYDDWNVHLHKGVDIPLSRNFRKEIDGVYFELLRRIL